MSEYEHFVPPAPESSLDKYSFHLIKSLDELESILSKMDTKIAVDTETSGLDFNKNFIVGYSFAINSEEGYYVPIKHYSGISLGQEAIDVLAKYLYKAKIVLMYNAIFDMRFLEKYGIDFSKVNVHDVMLWCWLSDTNWKKNSLKFYSKHFLGIRQPTFEETLGLNKSFYYVTSEEGYFYAAVDALMTYLLALVSVKYYKEAGVSGKILSKFLYPLMKIEEEDVQLNIEYFYKMREDLKKSLQEDEETIYKLSGKVFNIGSSQQLAEVLLSNGISTGHYTKGGAMSTNLNYLSRIDHPIVKYILDYKKKSKKLSAYVEPFIKYYESTKSNKAKFHYIPYRVPTSRLAAGKDGRNTYFIPVNVQSLPKSSVDYHYVERTENLSESVDGYDILGWTFSQSPISNKKVETQSLDINVRHGLVAPEGWYWVSVDYSGQELRITANMSHNKTWVDSYKHGIDIHKQTAIKIWGEESYDKDKRKKAKVVSFGILYGGSEYTISERLGVPLSEAQKIYSDYKKAFPELFQWITKHQRESAKRGVAYNYFGLPRRIKYYVNSSDPKLRAFGYRTAINTVIQSFGAEILRLAMIRVWNHLLSKYPDRIKFQVTVHDEINFIVKKEYLKPILNELRSLMTIEVPGWEVPLTVDFQIGSSFGNLYPFKYVNGEWVPDYEEESMQSQEESISLEEVKEEDKDDLDIDSFNDVIESDDYRIFDEI